MSALFHLDRGSQATLQQQVREHLVNAILGGFLPLDKPLPSSRSLAKNLHVARNTITLVYDELVSDGYLISSERRGYYVNDQFFARSLKNILNEPPLTTDADINKVNWLERLKVKTGPQPNASQSHSWQSYQYPFVYGQLDTSLFPINNWRKCWKDAVSVQAIRDWSSDRYDSDDPLLIEQLQQRILPSRGIQASSEEILITVGSQQAIYLLAQLLLDNKSCFGIEDPGYVSAGHIALVFNARVKSLQIDGDGMIVDQQLNECDLVYLTPSHQCPTAVTMPLARRLALLTTAQQQDFIVIEDDYEMEMSFDTHPTPALKSLDKTERVLYIGSLSKTLAPGLRMGFMVGPKALIQEARNLRQLMLRHPPLNNQRAVALFLAQGYHDALLRKLARVFQERGECLAQALKQHLPDCISSPISGSSCWLKLPEHIDAGQLKQRAAKEGLLLISANSYHFGNHLPKNFLKIGLSAIPLEKIEPGIKLLAKIKAQLQA
ncbi:GntR family transcriptional regulator [Oceanisphaera marina]|uniref:GntR family transcriptional regulator n=1 Tax=Oceanisphaera marina TaxID=2017550 RepID=A0ABQ1ICF8_9GAMM|nr:PLP-dependent aminotransferase family protein [Oceanisphaera marina]GGB32597.1 GntR family transcriptional regulator [Oceanisphaera marina]